MTEPTQLVPSLTLLNDDGDFTIRIGSEKWATDLGQKLISLIGGMGVARKLTILTPTDTKVFKLTAPDSNGLPSRQETSATSARERGQEGVPVPLRPSQRISQDSSAPPSPELVGEYEAELAKQKADEESLREQQRLNGEIVEQPAPPEDVVEMPSPRKRTRTSKIADQLKAATACGRCSGAGSLEGGGTCPVCLGKGAIAHYGRR